MIAKLFPNYTNQLLPMRNLDFATNKVKSCYCAAAAAAVVVDALRKEIPRRIVESHALWVQWEEGREKEREAAAGVVCQTLWRFQVQRQGCMQEGAAAVASGGS